MAAVGVDSCGAPEDARAIEHAPFDGFAQADRDVAACARLAHGCDACSHELTREQRRSYCPCSLGIAITPEVFAVLAGEVHVQIDEARHGEQA